VDLAHSLGASRIQLNVIRPVPEGQGGAPEKAPLLSELGAAVTRAIERGDELGATVLTEAVPHCLGASGHASDAWALSDPPPVRIDDLHRQTEDLAGLRLAYRSQRAPCARCLDNALCPVTWTALTEAQGASALCPVLPPDV
jgi:hypothetical protein